jgi:hypothetical protein
MQAQLFVLDGETVRPLNPARLEEGGPSDCPARVVNLLYEMRGTIGYPVLIAIRNVLPRHGEWSDARLSRVMAQLRELLKHTDPVRRTVFARQLTEVLIGTIRLSRSVAYMHRLLAELRVAADDEHAKRVQDPSKGMEALKQLSQTEEVPLLTMPPDHDLAAAIFATLLLIP